MISAIILIKYEPQYEVSIKNNKIGYVTSQNDINKIIEDTITNNENKNIAFVDLKEVPILTLKLVNRNISKEDNETLKIGITEQIKIEYTNYAISIDGDNKTYVSSEEKAQEIINKVKDEYGEKYTDKLGIVQVYSENNEEIAALEYDEAKEVISKEVKKVKTSSSSVKMATKKTTTKLLNANGVKLSVKPVAGMITSRFGKRTSPGGFGSTNHKGLDIAAKSGTLIKSTASGKVTYAGYKGSLGNLIIIDHGNGVQTYYGHCSKLYVSKGDTVESGENIATVGKTGSATGYHLHFEIHINGTAVNPQKYMY